MYIFTPLLIDLYPDKWKACAYYSGGGRRMKEETKEILSETEREKAIKYYGYGWSFQEIAARILESRNEKIRTELEREVGMLMSKRFNRPMYPIEFYGKV